MATGIIGGAINPLDNPTNPATGTVTPPSPATTAPTPVASPVTPPSTTGYTPTSWNVDANQTVAGQVAKIIDPNSPIIQQARANALQTANGRGLLNSSIASTGADAASYAAAIPIATADAATSAKAAGYNADTQTTSDAFKANATNVQTGQKLSSDTSVGIANANNQAAQQVKQMDQATQQLVQNNSTATSAYNLYANSLYKNAENTTFNAQAKYDADQKAFSIFKQQISLASAISGVPDMSSQLTYGGIDPATGQPGASATPNSTGTIAR